MRVVLKTVLAVTKTVLAVTVLVGVAAAGLKAAEEYPALRPYVHPITETLREVFQVDSVIAMARELLAGPTSEPEGGGAAATAERRTKAVEATSKVVKSPPKVVKLPPKVTVTVNPTQVHKGWMVVCSHGAYHVPKEVYDSEAVCDDPSLGVPVEEGYRLGWEGIEKRVAEIRERYLSQQKAAAQQDSSQGN